LQKPTLIYYRVLKYQPENLARLHQDFTVIELQDPRSDDADRLGRADVILAPLGFFLGKEKIDMAPRLKVIGSNTTGHPHIDVDYAEAKNIRVVTLKGDHDFLETITPTAEMTWGLVIALTRNLIPAQRSVLEGTWDGRPVGGYEMLSRMDLGVVGYGLLGKMVAKYGIAFGMSVNYFDPYVFEEGDGIFRVETLDALVAQSDIVTVHLSHDEGTVRLFNREIFSKFKKGSFFINASRSEFVDHGALLDCLEKGTIAGAAMEVFEDEFGLDFESSMRAHPLWQYCVEHDNLILTPQIASEISDTKSLSERLVIERIIDVLVSKKKREQGVSLAQAIKRKDTWALITARGGSKSIPLKNMVDLNGRPLIDYAIEAGKSSKYVQRIVCSTENSKIKSFCVKSGIEICDRPLELAQDDVPSLDVILHFLQMALEKEKVLPEFLVLLEPTSPFVLAEHIDRCIEMLRGDPTADSSQTVCEVEPNSHAYNQRYKDNDVCRFVFAEKRKALFNKQLKPKFYIHGNVRVMRVQSVMLKEDIFGERSLPLVIPRVYGMDVDGPEQLQLARCICQCGLV